MTTTTDALQQVRKAGRRVAILETEQKNACLRRLAEDLRQALPEILEANAMDLEAAAEAGVNGPKLDRLRLDAAKIEAMAAGVEQVAGLPDPVLAETVNRTLDNGLQVRRVRTPIGVIMMIYEARPNVTVDAFALCFKSGNACILKGGKEASRSNTKLRDLIVAALTRDGLPAEAITLITGSDREELKELLRRDDVIDLVIPRGGEPLIRFVHEHSRIPTVQHFHGVCHLFVDASADLEQALDVCVNAKTSAPATCNSAEAVLVHLEIAPVFIPALCERMAAAGVEVRGDAATVQLAPGTRPATDADWGTEFLDRIVAVRVVDDLDGAIEHIERFGSDHTEVILTRDPNHAERFTREVQASCTLVNASTRFNDGFQLGLGAEIGISTSKVHAFGPMGLEELTVQRYVVQGNGHTR
ncbi:gamma-glutamyl phosphate reductase [Acidobacteria bacterium Mor1]|nr:gamma-glutamyl phosphate reductase [Acidobacteria bacterium Mor1]